MKIKTERFGEIEVPEESILNLKNGIIGFSECKRMILIDYKENSLFKWLQAVDEPYLAFPIIDPLLLVPDYPLEQIKESLTIDKKQPEEIAVMVIATVPPAPKPITVNLLAPIAFDAKTKIGDQLILNDKRFTIRHPLTSPETTSVETQAR